jgi:hypothetical protein
MLKKSIIFDLFSVSTIRAEFFFGFLDFEIPLQVQPTVQPSWEAAGRRDPKPLVLCEAPWGDYHSTVL